MMPRFFFNILHHADAPDLDGTELSDWREAQVEAIRLAGAVISDSAQHIKLDEDWTMEVTDDQRLILFVLDFHIAGSAGIALLADTHNPA